MGRRYGTAFRTRRIGRVSARGVSFSLRDPRLCYLERAFRGAEYEPAISTLLEGLLASGRPCFVDVGAHLGYFTIYAASLNPGCEVHAFEPGAEYFELLTENVGINAVEARTWPLALSDSSGRSAFGDRTFRVVAGGPTETVTTVTFDELRQSAGIRADVMKVDVHGCEGKVLFGMRAALREDLRHLLLEIHPHELLVDYDVEQILGLLVDSGLELFELDEFRSDRSGHLIPLEERHESLIRRELWSAEQVANRRMVYARRPG
jgi:FkbM family methyltransferase